ncbi:MAG: hypothetical protein JXR61_10555 [Prolixibacteraceae bacterium]|nr:hypothetical protein [Prolixibacteraceae bacterium]
MSNKITKNISELNDAVKQYLQAKLDLVKLRLLKKTANYMSTLFGMLISILILTLIIAFSGTAFTLWYGQTYSSYLDGALIMLGILILLLILFLIFRKKLLMSLFISKFSAILFEDDETTGI